ncbi:MAG: c-type cytochrome, partial [Planctomycetes bacterium]|nr:c-type cytochrome [Planctomycetota bacterium]
AAAARIPLLRQYMGRRLVDDAIARGDKGDLDDFTTILGDANDPSRVDFLMGAREGLRGRKSMKMPKGWAEVQARLKESTNATVREQAMLLALVFGDPQALADLRKTLLTTTRPVAERQAALVALLDKRQADLAPVLHDLLSDKELRRTALRGLASIPHEATPRLILDRYSQFTADDKQEAIATLSSRKDFALALLDALEKKKIAQLDITAFVARQLHTLGDKEVTERLRKSWGEVRDTQPEKQEQIARYKKMLTPTFLKNADLANGRLLYSKSCMACHQLHGEGGKIGPDLSGTNRTNLDYLLSNIVDPSAEIGRDFRMSAVHTASGRVVTGIIAERTPARITIQTATERLVISPEEVDEIRDSKVSMMPEGQLEQLTKEQIRDLFAYLAQQKQVPLPR